MTGLPKRKMTADEFPAWTSVTSSADGWHDAGTRRHMGYRPEVYDAVTAVSIQGDVDWYRSQAQACGGPVLELGAGTGRVTLAIATAGIPIHALDASEAMLGALRRKLATHPQEVQDRVVTVQGDMRTFDLDQRFALVIAPFRAFLHNITEEDRLARLDRVRRHLLPGGHFAFNVFHPSLGYMAQHAGPLAGVWRWTGTFALPAGGCVVCSEANRYDTVRQIVHSLHRYEEYAEDGTLTRTSLNPLKLAYLYPADIRRLLVQAGFRDVKIAGSFAGREVLQDTDELVIDAC
jgi:ubiquinone/menaquinone biosynthesis C-methylase UbiE